MYMFILRVHMQPVIIMLIYTEKNRKKKPNPNDTGWKFVIFESLMLWVESNYV